jgi:hypothetical protein
MVLAGAGSIAVLVNALFLQSGPHPAPILVERSRPVTPADPTGSFVAAVPRSRPPELGARADAATPHRARSDMVSEASNHPATIAVGSRADAIGELITTSSRRVLAVQRALGDFGYGPVKSTGVFSPETKAAIEKFERDRKLPVTGQISDRLMRELAAVTGRPIE